ncbi:MAG: protein kinase, partial [Acidobacteriota bacterium]
LSQTISNYRILYHIGTSLIGEVYLAEDLKLGRKVALLFLPEQFARDAERLQRLTQEARIISTLNHPNIRMMYEVGYAQANGEAQYFIANEWVEGPTLREHLAYTRMRVEEVLDVSTQIANGLAAAHAAGVLHRDLKPENVMIRPDGYVKVLDFGLAKLIEQDTMLVELESRASLPSALKEEAPVSDDAATTEIRISESGGIHDSRGVGNDPYRTKPLDAVEAAKLTTALSAKDRSAARSTTGLWWMPGITGYLSPEQIQGKTIDERSDLFSLGVMVYEMCTGRLPFEGQTTTTVLNSILQNAPLPIRRSMPDAPEELEWVVMKLLAKERDERYQTARELLNDLKRLRHRLEVEAEQARHSKAEDVAGNDALRRSGQNDQSEKPRLLETKAISRDSGKDAGRRTDVIGGRTGSSNPISSRSGSSRGSSGASRAFSEAIDSLAVLPLANIGNDPNAEYLSDGITESVINSLARVPGLRVMARSTVFRYKGKNTDPLEVGRELQVRAVFAGRLFLRGQDIVIKAELVDAEDGSLLWAEQYQRQLGKAGDIFELEKDIAKQISESLRVKLSGEQEAKLAKPQTDNPEAYELYLKGRYFWNQRSPDGLRKAAELFIQAIRKDPNYALAYAGLASCYSQLSTYLLPPREYIPKARMAVMKALELDDQLAEAHAAYASLLFWYDWEFDRAEKEFLLAADLNPNYTEAPQWCAYLYFSQERFDDGFRMLNKAKLRDPLSMPVASSLGELLYFVGRFEEAIVECEKTLQMDPTFARALYYRTLAWIGLGKLKEAIEFLKAIIEHRPDAKEMGTFVLA